GVAVLSAQRDEEAGRLDDAPDLFAYGLVQGVQAELRGKRPRDFREHLQFARALVGLHDRLGVLDRDGRLFGDGDHQVAIAFGVGVRARALHGDHADRASAETTSSLLASPCMMTGYGFQSSGVRMSNGTPSRNTWPHSEPCSGIGST